MLVAADMDAQRLEDKLTAEEEEARAAWLAEKDKFKSEKLEKIWARASEKLESFQRQQRAGVAEVMKGSCMWVHLVHGAGHGACCSCCCKQQVNLIAGSRCPLKESYGPPGGIQLTTGTGPPPEEISQLSKKFDSVLQLLSISAHQHQMSTAGIERAEKVLQKLRLTEIDGDQVYKRDSVPSNFVSVKPFDLMQYENEKLATAPFATYLMDQLTRAGANMGKGGFSVLDLHARDGRLELTIDQEHGPVTFTGVIDTGVVPYGVMGRCGHVLRAGIELIYTEAQKKAREQMQEQQGLKRKREADDSAVDMPDVQGLEYSAEPKAQIILQLLSAYSVVEHPLALYLTDGAVYHRVTLIGKEVVCWRNLTPQAALHCMVQELEKAPTGVGYELDESVVAPKLAESVKFMHAAVGNNALAEQLEAILPHIDTSVEKLATAMQLIQAHYPAQANTEVPSWLQQCLE